MRHTGFAGYGSVNMKAETATRLKPYSHEAADTMGFGADAVVPYHGYTDAVDRQLVKPVPAEVFDAVVGGALGILVSERDQIEREILPLMDAPVILWEAEETTVKVKPQTAVDVALVNSFMRETGDHVSDYAVSMDDYVEMYGSVVTGYNNTVADPK